MRKLKLQVQISVDGFIAGPDGEMDWMVWNWDKALEQYIGSITEPVDCILLGRRLAQGFISYWGEVAGNPENVQNSAGVKFTNTHKVIFTHTLEQPDAGWKNTVLAKDDTKGTINQLKQQEGGDIMVYGGAGFVSFLLQNGLIDEFHLLVNPAIIGSGMPIFKELKNKQNLELVKAIPFECGIALLHYALKKNE